MTFALVSLSILVILLSFGIPLPFCFGAALMYMNLVADVSMKGMMMWGLQQILSPVLLCAPLFIFAGGLMSESGIARSLLDYVDSFVGRIRGGLGVVAAVSCAIIGAISGSGLTGLAATGPILIPRMAERGYPRGYAAALVTDSSILGLLIPPSVVMVIYGWVTETSILACFLSTLVPGLMITFLFSSINVFMARKFPLVMDPELPPAERRADKRKKFRAALPALLMPVIILGGIYGGIMTPTEAAAVAVVYSIPLGFWVYKGLTWSSFFRVTKDSTSAVGSILLMIFCSLMLSQTYVMLQVPQEIVKTLFGVTESKVLLLILINFMLFFLGMIVNDITGVILVAPLLLPLVVAIGVHPVQFAAIIGVNLAMGGVTPPYASILYLGMRIGKVEFVDILKPAMTFILLGYVPVVFLVSFFPELSLFLPRVMGLLR